MKELHRYQALELVAYLPFFARITISSWSLIVVLLFYLSVSTTYIYTNWLKTQCRGSSTCYWLELKKLIELGVIVAIAVENIYPGILVAILAIVSYYCSKRIYNKNVEKFAICVLLISDSSYFRIFSTICLLYSYEIKLSRDYHSTNKHKRIFTITSNFLIATAGMTTYQVLIVFVTVVVLTSIAMLSEKPNQFEEKSTEDEIYNI